MRHILTLVAILFATIPAIAQQNATPLPSHNGPRIGLVLGGGGARGFAHVGVLEVMEQNRIPVHAIAGTSMGAVVGSLYASGKTAEEIAAITREISWVTVFNDAIPRERVPFRRKRDQRDVLIDYRISFDDNGLVLPKGVLRGQDLFLTLAEYLAPARSVTDFDNLAIPFRAVATDIVTTRPEVMGDGDIATAVFASMSVPGGLPPVERDGKLLVDGMLVDNVPVEIARQMGVDVVIVVDVSSPLRTRDQITSFLSVLDQMQLMLGRHSIDRQIAAMGGRDVLIRPDITHIGTTSFERSELGIERGRTAANEVVEKLRALSLSQSDWQAHLAARAARAPRNAPTLDFVQVENRSDFPTRKIRDMVSAKPGQPLDAKQMTEDLQNIYALGGFRAVRYGIGPGKQTTADRRSAEEGTGDRSTANQSLGEGVTVLAEGDPSSANWLQLGIGLATDFNLNSVLRLGVAYTDRNWLGTGAEWRSDIRVGTNLKFETGLYKEFGRYFAEITPYWSRVDTIFFVDEDAVAAVRDARLGARLEGGKLFGNWGELRLGFNWAQVNLKTTVGTPDIPPQSLQDVTVRAVFTADTLDNISFPTRGLYGFVAYTDHVGWFGGDLTYGAIEAKLFAPISWARNTLVLSGEIGITSEGDGRSLGDFRLGGFLNLSGLEPDQLIGRHKMLGRAIFYHRLSEVAPIINVPVYIGGSLEVGNAWRSLDDVGFGSLRTAGSLFVAVDTPIGPLAFASGLSRGSGAVYLILGRIF